MSTASPDTWADVSGVATHRAASASEPYSETASRRSCSWYSGERQPLSTESSTPSSAASLLLGAGRRADQHRAWPRPGSRRRRPSCRRARHRRPRRAHRGAHARGTSVGDARPPSRTRTPATGSRGLRRSPRWRRAGRRHGSSGSGSAGSSFVPVRVEVTPPVKTAGGCRRVCGFRYAGDMRRPVASEHPCVDRRGRALHGRSHPRWPTPGSDRRRHRR